MLSLRFLKDRCRGPLILSQSSKRPLSSRNCASLTTAATSFSSAGGVALRGDFARTRSRCSRILIVAKTRARVGAPHEFLFPSGLNGAFLGYRPQFRVRPPGPRGFFGPVSLAPARLPVCRKLRIELGFVGAVITVSFAIGKTSPACVPADVRPKEPARCGVTLGVPIAAWRPPVGKHPQARRMLLIFRRLPSVSRDASRRARPP